MCIIDLDILYASKSIMKIKFSSDIIREQFEKANIWQKCEIVIGVFCEFVYLWLMTILNILKKICEYLKQFFTTPKKENDHNHHCEQVQQVQKRLDEIVDQQNKQQLLLQSILDYVQLRETDQFKLDRLREKFERQFNQPISYENEEEKDDSGDE